jgi:phosphate transport system protein
VRESFHDELGQLSHTLVEMSHVVGSMMSRSTTALLDADVPLAEGVVRQELAVDEMRNGVEETILELLARHQPVASDLRVMISSLHVVTDLERMGDLAVHVAKIVLMRAPRSAVPAELRSVLLQMGQVAERVVEKASSTLAARDTDLAAEIAADDDSMDALHRKLFTYLLGGRWSHGVEAAIDITLLGRYYERFADHAVAVARRVVFLVTGEMPVPANGRP